MMKWIVLVQRRQRSWVKISGTSGVWFHDLSFVDQHHTHSIMLPPKSNPKDMIENLVIYPLTEDVKSKFRQQFKPSAGECVQVTVKVFHNWRVWVDFPGWPRFPPLIIWIHSENLSIDSTQIQRVSSQWFKLTYVNQSSQVRIGSHALNNHQCASPAL